MEGADKKSARFEELKQKFPDTPESVIIKVDVIREGVKFTKDMEIAGRKNISFPYTKDGKFSLAPSYFILDDGTTVLSIPQTEAPWEYKKVEDEYWLYRDGAPITKVNFQPRPDYITKQTKDGSMMGVLAFQRGDSCLFISPLNFCEYFKKGEECKYCAFNPIWENAKFVGAKQRPKAETIKEAVLSAMEEVDIDHLKLCGGGLYDTKAEAKIYSKVAQTLRDATHVKQIDMVSQAYEEDDMKLLRDSGIKSVCQDVEVWDEKLWPEIVPGKAHAVGREEWLKRLCDAVGVLGEGQVATNLVGGIEMVPKNGFKTMEEAVNSTAEGCEWLIKNSIEPTISVWFASPGSKYENETTAPTEYHLEVGWKNHKLLEKYGMYEKFGYKKMGTNPPRRIICYKCCFDNISQDYPRLIGRNGGS